MYTHVDTNVYEMFARLICAILLKMQCLIKIVMENKDSLAIGIYGVHIEIHITL